MNQSEMPKRDLFSDNTFHILFYELIKMNSNETHVTTLSNSTSNLQPPLPTPPPLKKVHGTVTALSSVIVTPKRAARVDRCSKQRRGLWLKSISCGQGFASPLWEARSDESSAGAALRVCVRACVRACVCVCVCVC